MRPARHGDLDRLLPLLHALHPDDPSLPPARAAATWRRILGQEGRTLLVAEAPGDPSGPLAGTVDCLVVPNLTRGAAPYLLVENVVVGERHRRTGIGRLLLEEAVAIATRSGCYKVQLLSALARDTEAFYTACGFQPRAQGWRRYLTAVGGR